MNQQSRSLFIVLGTVVVLLLLGPLLMGGMLGPGVFGRGMMGWGFTGDVTSGNGWLWGLGMGVGGLMMLAFWGVIIAGIVLFVRWIGSQQASGTGLHASAAEDPLSILRRRYAAGEIDQPTYERMTSELTDPANRPRQPVVANGRTQDRSVRE
jgi:uncharacterized membrane protein